jgi:Zn-dependent protease
MTHEWFLNASAWVIPVLIAVTLHEAAHGWMAEKFGDDTARSLGRVTFNPIRHVDPFGTVIFPGLLFLMGSPFLFGWAKPVPVNFNRLRPPAMGMFMVAFAGPGINILIALVSALLLHIDQFVTPENMPWIFLNLYRLIMVNCVIAVFNLLPVLPLDGGRVLHSLLPYNLKRAYGRTERYGVVVILALLLVFPLLGMDIVPTLVGAPALWLDEQLLWLTGNSE